MIENLPQYITLAFILTTFATLFLFGWTVRNSSSEKTRNKSFIVLIGLISWLVAQAVIAFNNVYCADPVLFPPKLFLFGVLPSLLMILIVFTNTNGKRFIDSLPLSHLTYLHTIRIAVEIIFIPLCAHKLIPQLMTFQGKNFDILAGISAPLVAYYGIVRKKAGRNLILAWNIISLLLLLNIVVIALLSMPSPVQKLAFDQPNIAILYFPFSWLPAFIVPVVLFSHLASIRQLTRKIRR